MLEKLGITHVGSHCAGLTSARTTPEPPAAPSLPRLYLRFRRSAATGVVHPKQRGAHFKNLDDPTPDRIFQAIDPTVLETDWGQSLRHQLPVLPPADEFLAALGEVLDWLFGVEAASVPLQTVPGRAGEVKVPPVHFTRPAPTAVLGRGVPAIPGGWLADSFGSRMDGVRYGARNRLLVRIDYHGVSRLVEPYSLRVPRTGNLLLYVFEVQRGGGPGGGIKALKVAEIGNVAVTRQPFQPQYLIEL